MLFDSHCHINTEAFSLDADRVIKRALENNTALVIIGTDYKSSKRALEYANKYESGVWAAVGLHPQSLRPYTEESNGVVKEIPAEIFNSDMYSVLSKFPKTVAVGEIGLDYAWRDGDTDISVRKEEQKKVLK